MTQDLDPTIAPQKVKWDFFPKYFVISYGTCRKNYSVAFFCRTAGEFLPTENEIQEAGITECLAAADFYFLLLSYNLTETRTWI